MSVMSRASKIGKLIRQKGVVRIAAAIVDCGIPCLTEAELRAAVAEYAQPHRCSGETAEDVFARVFAAQTPAGVLFRKAHAIVQDFEAAEV